MGDKENPILNQKLKLRRNRPRKEELFQVRKEVKGQNLEMKPKL